MSVDAFIPEIWAAGLLESLKKKLVYGQPSVVNRNYEGDIADQGDTVHIVSVSRPTISNYTRNSTTITAENIQDAGQVLVIDQAKYFAFGIDDIDARQAKDGGALMDMAGVEAAYGLGDTADQFLAGLYTGVQSANAVGTVPVTSAAPDDAYDKVLVPLKQKLDEANVPDEARFAVIPPWFLGRLLRDDRFIRWDASQAGATEAFRNGHVGRAIGFDILLSNNTPVPGGDDNIVIAGYPGAISYAEQIVKTEAQRSLTQFQDIVRGLHVYGGKLVRPDGIATCQASQT